MGIVVYSLIRVLPDLYHHPVGLSFPRFFLWRTEVVQDLVTNFHQPESWKKGSDR